MAAKNAEDFDRRQREQMGKIVGVAYEGRLKWVDELILKAGYARGDMGAVPARVIARLYGVTPQAVGLWHSKSACPRNEDGTYDVAEVVEGRGSDAKGRKAGGRSRPTTGGRS